MTSENHNFNNISPAEDVSGDAVRARLKWFNEPKGFGFVVLEDGNVDAFLHITTLQRAGLETLQDGACLLCHVDRGPKGAQVRQIVSLLEADAIPATDLPGDEEGIIAHMHGTIKWYKQDKGFGFVTPDDGLKDVFIHKSCLEQKGLDDMRPGIRIHMKIRIVPKGREVIDFDILPPAAAPDPQAEA